MKVQKSIKIIVSVCLIVCLALLGGCTKENGATQLSGSVFNEYERTALTSTYLKIDGIEGQSYDSAHQKWVDLADFSIGAEQTVEGVDMAGRCKFDALVFSHVVDVATPKLQEACCKGNYIKSMQLDKCEAIAGKQVVLLSIKLEGCKITSAVIEADEESDKVIETVKVAYNKATWTVKQIGLDNSIGGTVETTYDSTKNY